MAGEQVGQQHFKLPYDAVISPRSSAGNLIGAEDEETPSRDYLAAGFLRYQEALTEIARQAENRSFPVDEYNTVPLSGGSTGTLMTIMPTYDFMPEKIESVLVSGPAAATATLILGDRQFPLTVPASGIIVIAPVAIILGRNDARQLTSAVPGIWFVELMGIADKRFQT
jgi:hypothetical protein